jgi:hypothetical protein
VRSKLSSSPTVISADLLFKARNRVNIIWQFNWGLRSGLNIREIVWKQSPRDATPIKLVEYIRGRMEAPAYLKVQVQGIKLSGSVLSLIPDHSTTENTDDLHSVSAWASGIRSLELLSPISMRRQVRGRHRDIGSRGELLSSFLAQLDPSSKNRLVERITEFYPLQRIETKRKRAGWVDLQIAEAFRGIGNISPDHLSDGFLRLLALCAIPELPPSVSLVLLDEIEDGIDPHILPKLVTRVIKESPAQFIMTSHSPLVVNFVGRDEIAFVGRLGDGQVATAPFGNFDSVQEGLEYFGSGELWAMIARESLENQLVKESEKYSVVPVSGNLRRFTEEYVREFIEET